MIEGAAGTNYCGDYFRQPSGPATPHRSGFIINQLLIPEPYPMQCHAFAINGNPTNAVAVGVLGSQPVYIQGGKVKDLQGTDAPHAVNDAAMISSATPPTTNYGQIVGGTSIWDYTDYEGNPTTSYYVKNVNKLIPPNSGWILGAANSLRGINDSGAIVGTATKTSDGSSHGILLLPLQLKLLNGSTPNFDGSIPTSWIPSPEFPNYSDAVAATSGVTSLGPFVITALNGQGNYNTSGYYYALMVAAQAPGNISGIQYKWKRYWKGRQWYLIYNNSTGDWDVSNRGSWGTDPSEAANNGKDDTGPPNDSIPSTTKHEFYAADSPGLGYGHDANDSQCHSGDYIDEEETFTYKVQYSFDGTNWQDGTSLIFHHQITVQFKQNYTGNLSNDLNLVTNSISNGDNDPTMTLTKAAFVTGSGHINLESGANVTGF